MQAVRKLGPGKGHVELAEVPEPQPGPGQVLIEVRAAGICGTDLHIEDGEFPCRPPVTLGHEVAGVVRAVGPGVPDVPPGLRVTTETYFHYCERCEHCRAGRPNLCAERRSIGSAVDGGFAELLVVPARNLHALPEGVSDREGALTEPLACVVRGVLELGEIRAGDRVAIAGPGAIGLMALQLALLSGARASVIGTEADAERLERVRLLGGVPLLAGEPVSDAPDVVIDCSGAGPAVAALLAAVRKGGRYIQIGLAGRPITVDFDQICYKELRVTGSNATAPSSWRRALRLMAEGQVRLDAVTGEAYPLSQWGAAFAAVRSRRPGKPLLLPGR